MILAPHLVGLTKKELGLPHVDEATERQRRDGMCWKNEDEIYNDGERLQDHLPRPARRDGDDHRRQLLRLLQEGSQNADQLRREPVRARAKRSMPAGRIAFPAYVLGQDFYADRTVHAEDRPRSTTRCSCSATASSCKPEGYAVDRRYPDILYVPENAEFNVRDGRRPLDADGKTHEHHAARRRHLCPAVGLQDAAGETACRRSLAPGRHRAPTARSATSRARSPAAASRRSRSRIADVLLKGPVFVSDYQSDMDAGRRDSEPRLLADVYRNRGPTDRASRPILSLERSLGSVIKLLTPSAEYTDEYNAWLRSHSADHPATRLHRQALLPAGVGRRTGASISPSTASTASSGTS